MGWSIGYDETWRRDIGYGVPAYCDHPGCTAEIHRGLSYVCCATQPHGGDTGCGRYFCSEHMAVEYDDDDEPRCGHIDQDHVSADHPDWLQWKLGDASWQGWREEHPEQVERLRHMLSEPVREPRADKDTDTTSAKKPAETRAVSGLRQPRAEFRAERKEAKMAESQETRALTADAADPCPFCGVDLEGETSSLGRQWRHPVSGGRCFMGSRIVFEDQLDEWNRRKPAVSDAAHYQARRAAADYEAARHEHRGYGEAALAMYRGICRVLDELDGVTRR